MGDENGVGRKEFGFEFRTLLPLLVWRSYVKGISGCKTGHGYMMLQARNL